MNSVEGEYARIDVVRSVSEMRSALAALEEDLRRRVIILGLRTSKFQFSWSFFAKAFGVPRAEWPPQPKVTT